MPCDDCSRTETCPPCPEGEDEKPDPQGSGPSSTDLHKWKRCIGCGHAQHSVRCAESVSLDEYKQGVCDCLELTPAVDIAKTCRSGGGCSKHPKTVLFEKYKKPKPKPCTCGPNETCGDPCTPVCPPACIEGHTYSGSCMLRALGPGEPPLTPEEEEEAPEDRIHPADCAQRDGCPYLKPTCENGCKAAADMLTLMGQDMAPLPPPEGPEYTRCVCGHILPEHEPHGGLCFVDGCDCCEYRTERRCSEVENCDGSCCAKLPPQPERRAPYVATYSVGGHLYEVAVPGDACLQAVDGALVIRHGLGPVAGLVGFQPLTVEEQR